jgi:hypothetical protein
MDSRRRAEEDEEETDFQTLDGAAAMALDSWSTIYSTMLTGRLHVCQCVRPLLTLIVDHEVQSYWIHVCSDLLFFFSCQDDVMQLIKQMETLY